MDDEFQVLHEFVKAARRNLGDNEWDYIVGGADTETTLRRNRQALDRIAFRPRVLRDVSGLDASTSFLGRDLRLPVILAPIGSLQDFHPDGGAGATRAAAEFGVFHMLSSVCLPGLEAVAEANGDGAKIFQLYVRGDPDWVDDHVRRAVAAGYDAFCVTVDLDYYGRRERDIAKRHKSTSRRNYAVGEDNQQRFNWADIDRIRDLSDIPLIVKGIATAEDAALCVEHGVDAVYVSNHGGRQLDHGRGGAEVLPEIVAAVDGRARVVLDGGIYRGADVVKAMALGADAVGMGRMQAYAMASGGAPAVVRMLELLEIEVQTCLALLGVTGWDELDGSYLHPAETVREADVLSAFPLIEEGY